MELLLLDNKAVDGYDRCRSVLDHSQILVDGTEAGRRVPTSIDFVRVTGVAVPDGLPEIADGESPFFQKLVNVTKLVQEQFRCDRRVGRNKYRAPKSDCRGGIGAERPTAYSHR